MNPIEKNSKLILKALVEDGKEQYNNGQISSLTNLTPQEISDAVDYLDSIGALKSYVESGMKPYDFTGIFMKSRGRYLYNQIIEREKEKNENNTSDPSSTDSLESKNNKTKINSKLPNAKKMLAKLVELMKDPIITDGYDSNDNLIAWASKVVPLLQYNPQYQSKFMSYQDIAIVSHLKMQTRQAFQLMKSQVTMAIEEIKLMIDLENSDDGLQEKFFPKGFYYDASKMLGDIIKSAKSKIFLIDNYIDQNILDFFTLKEQCVELFIMTQNMKSAMKHYAKQFSLQHGFLQIRNSKDYHDRFLIIDETTFYHFGASLKDLGNKAFMFSKIEEETNKHALLEKWHQDWASSNNIL